jgi:hypothetical protein
MPRLAAKPTRIQKKATLNRENPEMLNPLPTAGSLTGWPSEADIFALNLLQG